MGPPWKEGEIRLEVDKVYFELKLLLYHSVSVRSPPWADLISPKRDIIESNFLTLKKLEKPRFEPTPLGAMCELIDK